MQTIDVSQAQSMFPRLLEAVAAGDEVILTRNAEPFAKLSLVNGSESVHLKSSGRWEPGSAKGLIHIREDFDDPIEDFAEYLP
jgi:antitoxin (DNA-binding transcriptional repressor) of toxin-antitoxin stability system